MRIDRTITSAAAEMAAQQPHAIALDYYGERWTYAELVDQSARLAAGLADAGVSHGSRVTLFAQNVPEHVLLFLALARLGAINAAINPMWTRDEVRYLISDAESTVVIASVDCMEAMQKAVVGLDVQVFQIARSMDTPELHPAELPEGVRDFAELFAHEPLVEDLAAPGDTAALWYTSGTTGRPKGAIWAHSTFLQNGITTSAECYGAGPGDSVLCPIPVAHNGLSVAAVGPMLAGATLYLQRRVDPKDMLQTMLNERITYMATAPAVMNILMIHAATVGVDSLPDMKVIAVGGAVITPEMLARLNTFLPNCECGVIFAGSEGYYGTWLPSQGPEKLGSVGLPYPGQEWRVVDLNWDPVGPGEVGTIASRGPGCMVGYWNRPEANREVFRDGWMAVGDLGQIDEDGYLWFVGRDRDVIDSGGFNVYASEVESVLASVGAVGISAVIGEADDVLGEQVVAYVAPAPGAAIVVDDLKAVCEERLAKYKRPAQYRVRETLPVNSLGKVLKHELAQ